MVGDCPDNLTHMTEIMKNGMVFIVSNYAQDNLSFLHHDRCDKTVPCPGQPDVKIKNLRFITKDFVNPAAALIPMDGSSFDTPPSLEGTATPRAEDATRLVPILGEEATDVADVSPECRDRVRVADQFCHGIGEGAGIFVDYTDDSGECSQEGLIERFFC